MSIEIGAVQILSLLALIVGGAFAFWNLRAYLRLRRVVYRPRLSGRVRHGDNRRAETALMRKTFIQCLAWSVGTLAFIVFAVPHLAAFWTGA